MKLHAIVPVYNVEPYIRDFLDSLCIQTLPNVEYILINDGSTDKSGEICNSYAKKDSRIHVHHLSNGGVSKARNYALEIVSTQANEDDYILFFDPDDYLTYKDALADIQFELSETSPDLLYYNCSINNSLIDNILLGGVILDKQIGEALYPAILFDDKYNGKSLAASLFRGAFSTRIIKNHKLRFREDIRKAEDTLFYARFMTLTHKVALSTLCPYNYRRRPNSLSTSFNVPSLVGVEKGLSILSDFEKYAYQCNGIDKNKVASYFKKRYISLVINHVIGITDPRSGMTKKEIKNRISSLFSDPIISSKLKETTVADGLPLRQKVESVIVQKKNGLILYGKIFHTLKIIHQKTKPRC